MWPRLICTQRPTHDCLGHGSSVTTEGNRWPHKTDSSNAPFTAVSSFSPEIWLGAFFRIQNTDVNCLGISLFLLNNARENEMWPVSFTAIGKKKTQNSTVMFWPAADGSVSSAYYGFWEVLLWRSFQAAAGRSPAVCRTCSGGLQSKPCTFTGMGKDRNTEGIYVYIYTHMCVYVCLRWDLSIGEEREKPGVPLGAQPVSAFATRARRRIWFSPDFNTVGEETWPWVAVPGKDGNLRFAQVSVGWWERGAHCEVPQVGVGEHGTN